MKLILALMVQDEAHWLRLHLPVYLDSGAFDAVIAVDGGSTDDTVAVLQGFGAKVFHRTFSLNWSAQGNFLIACCEAEGGTHLIRCDPDELMHPHDLRTARDLLAEGTHDMLAFPRYNFIGDRLHHREDWLPDYQQRAWALNRGIHYSGEAVHETPVNAMYTLYCTDIPIYHYAWIAPAPERAYRTALYQAAQNGTALPNRGDYAGYTLTIPRVPFTEAQPLDPQQIGVRAPYAND